MPGISETIGSHRAAGQQYRDARRDRRAEHHDQQYQRDRHRRQLGLVEVLAHQRVGGLVGAGITGLMDDQPGMAGLHRGYRGQVRVDRAVRAGVGQATWKVTRAVRPSAEISAWPPGPSGDGCPRAAWGNRSSALTTSATALRSGKFLMHAWR